MDMYVQVSSGPFPSQNTMPEVPRRSANYHPSIWKYHFLEHASVDAKSDAGIEELFKQLKEEVRGMLVAAADKPSEQLNLINDIQRLGVSYHFESEIDAALQQVFDIAHEPDHTDDLYTAALRFRLLRQQGYQVPCGVFENFKDKEGKFKESLVSDVRGMLSLYEATHLRVRGEDVLDEALKFTTTHLAFAITQENNPLAAQVARALKQPIRKGLTRVQARHNFSIYDKDYQNKGLLSFAKLDFNLLQKMHQKEVSNITRWWKDLKFAEKLPFARDRVVECYFWILGVYFEPQYELARRIMTKTIALLSIMDDIYDVYGTLEELTVFTEAIQRWNTDALDQLPECLKFYYHSLLDVYNEIEEEMAGEGRSYCVHYVKAAVRLLPLKRLVGAYFEEAKWFNKGYIPTIEEYMQVALLSTTYELLATTSFLGMGDLATKGSFDWVTNDPLIVRASSVICRLMDDIVGHEFEQERGHVASAVECYMKRHGCSKEETYAEFQKQVTNAWKDINQECLRPTAVPMPLLTRVVNLARVMDLLYKDEDGYTNSKTFVKELVTSVLVDPVSM
ncbi:hypothetical protein RJ639_045677 [Escallonia herrerae]|uniref:Sesquiterpene synthase n=1 Tax=Escallonia herrerae TaxID=1293975 RepID=A0AA88W8F7_9ASTE|nr:hypothetical protein RJ639_045677 [Escallonia herrerae]